MTKVNHRRSRAAALKMSSASALSIGALLFSTGALAQTAPTDHAADAASGSDIVVTATRVVRDGYKAPTPTTVVSAADIAEKAPANLADYLNTLPALQGSSTPRNTISATSAGTGGINALSLRNLGANRTVVLLDGQRVAAQTLGGLVDINELPQSLVQRVDVVTGGASASYGSDAVAGVVNFILDKKFTGLKGEVQGGVTTYGDDRSYKASLTAGTSFGDGRGHFLLAGEIARNDGIRGTPRPWYDGKKLFFNPAYSATNGQPQLLVRDNAGFSTVAPGGIITAGPLAGIYFGQGGTPTQLNLGSTVSAPVMVGGDWKYTDFGTSADLDPRLSRQNVFGYLSYNLTDHVQAYGQASYAVADSYVQGGLQYQFANITVRRDNAFLPASIAARMDALGLTTLTLGSTNQDLGDRNVRTHRTLFRSVVGFTGDVDALGSTWKWDVYGQRSRNYSLVEAYVTVNARYTAAIDSVRGANGAIVCRSTLTNPTNGCVPYDIFGTGVNSQGAVDALYGTAIGRTYLQQDVVAANLNGSPFSNWAGPISIAAGIEHRREATSGSSDALSQSTAYFTGNYKPSFGSYQVTEGYLETVVPIAKDIAVAKSLDLSAAVRATDYSTSGYVTTWKIGLTYSPIEDITVRGTRSRDIRAPNLAELFQGGTTVTAVFSDPSRNNATSTGFTVTSGNPTLRPEKADSWGVGVVVQPRILHGFSASIDYYDTAIADAISTVTAPTLISQCAAGNTALCGQIVRNAAGAITQVNVQPINLSKLIARGLDMEASLRRHVAIAPSFQGSLTLRALATRYLENYANNGINAPTDTVGTNSANGSSALSLPKWSYSIAATWDQDPLSLTLTGRGISAGVYNTSYIECTSSCPASTPTNMTIEDNQIPGAFYLDGNVTVKLPHAIQAYLSIDNLLNKNPVQVAYGTSITGAPLSVNPTLYDVLGRTFRVGLRFRI